MKKKYDFSGWATRNDVRCSDGRTIRQDAFKEQDGQIVPLVWQHQHSSLDNVLGHALLENRPEGVYAYGKFNNTEMGRTAKEAVTNGDLTSLSIYANQLKHQGHDVVHGMIREVSLVLAGANPLARIEDLSLEHSEDGERLEDIFCAEKPISLAHSDDDDEDDELEDLQEEIEDDKENEEDIEHADKENDEEDDDETVNDVMDTLTEKQTQAVEYLIEEALKIGENMKHSDLEEEDTDMKNNVFDNTNENMDMQALQHAEELKAEFKEIVEEAQSCGSLRKAFLAHAEGDYGITNINYLFPDYKTLRTTPEFVKRDTDWVSKVINGTHHTPFSRIKSVFADLREEDARAKGYIKGNRKIEEVFTLLKRTTDPQTIYKKQKLDRDDVIDITDFDVVAWIKGEMRMMLDEEIARAVLVGDGRSSASNDHINPLHIRPIWQDDEFYTIQATVAFENTDSEDAKAKKIIRKALRSRKDYKGSGNPTFFTTEDTITTLLLLEDGVGRRIYNSINELAIALRVNEIVAVPVMENLTREVNGTTHTLLGLIVNLNDYNIGADKGGAVNMFEDFDIDYNQQKYLIETRCSGALVKPYSAIAIECTGNFL